MEALDSQRQGDYVIAEMSFLLTITNI